MEDQKNKWVEAVLNSHKGYTPMSAPLDLQNRVMAKIDMKAAVLKLVPLRYAAVAAMIVMSINIAAFKYSTINTHIEQPPTAIAASNTHYDLISDFKIYD